MKYNYVSQYCENQELSAAVDKIAQNIELTPSNVIIIASMKAMNTAEIIATAKDTVKAQQNAFSPIFTEPVHFLRTLDTMFADEAKFNVMKTLAEDMHKGELLTDNEFISAIDAINKIHEGASIIGIIESCDAILKMMRKFELGHVEIFATATFLIDNAMQIEVGVRCIDPADVFFSNLSKIPVIDQIMLITAILAKMRIDNKLTTEEARDMNICFIQNIMPPEALSDKVAALLREDYVFLCDDNGEMKIGFKDESETI